jgi:drug/metabolite transporter (DMT)-like permease
MRGDDNLRGSLLMVAAMAGFAVEDMFLKAAARLMPLGEVLMIFGAIGTVAFALMALGRREAPFPRAGLTRPLLIRSGFEVTGRLFYALAITLTPLSSASAILQATPLVVMLGAALLFRERIDMRRWLAVGVGFAGVLVILRPGVEGFQALSLLAVIGMIGFAGRDLATRAAPPTLSNAQLGVAGFAMLTLSGAIILTFSGGTVVPPAPALALTLGASLFGVAAYAGLTGAMRTGEVSVVTPFRYTRLVFAMILGVAIFGERPDAATLAGAALIVASGLYTLTRRDPRR